jgi:competence protein ComEA
MFKATRLAALCLTCLVPTLAWCEPVDINTADAKTIATALKGVGEKTAEAIVAYRSANGPFKSVDELRNVKGIGDRLLEQNRSNLRVGAESPPHE